MQQEIFLKLDPSEAETALTRLNPLFGGSVFKPEKTTILTQNLPFYPGYRFLDILSSVSNPPKRRYVLESADKAIILDFTNAPIYALNVELPIRLDKKNVDDYVRFFFKNVRGEHGKFLIIETVDDIPWKNDPPPNARKAVGKMIDPLQLEGIDDRGFYSLSASMIFKDSLFKTKIKVDTLGQISIQDEQLLIEDIPVLDEVFSQ
jgi:hypothetical protein